MLRCVIFLLNPVNLNYIFSIKCKNAKEQNELINK